MQLSTEKKKKFWKLSELMGFVDIRCSESVCLKGTGFSHNTEARIIVTNEKNSHPKWQSGI